MKTEEKDVDTDQAAHQCYLHYQSCREKTYRFWQTPSMHTQKKQGLAEAETLEYPPPTILDVIHVNNLLK